MKNEKIIIPLITVIIFFITNISVSYLFPTLKDVYAAIIGSIIGGLFLLVILILLKKNDDNKKT